MTVETEVRRILKEDADATTWSFKIDDVIGGETLADVVSFMDAKKRRMGAPVWLSAAAGVVALVGVGSYAVSHRSEPKVVSKAAPTTAAVPAVTTSIAPPVTTVVAPTSQVATTAAPAPTEAAPALVATGTFQGETWEVRRSGECWLISFGSGSNQTVCGSATGNGGFVGLSVIQNQHRFVAASLGSDVSKVQATYADGRVVDITPVAPGLVLLGIDAADTLVSLNAVGKDNQPITQVGGEIAGDTSVNIAVTNVSGVPAAVSTSTDANVSVNATTSNGSGTSSTQIIVSGSSVSVSASSSASGGSASASSGGSVTVSSNGNVSVSGSASASSGGTTVSIPDISFPDISIPDISIPDISIPNISVPRVAIPDISIPNISIPKISVTKVSVPDVSVPDTSDPDPEP
jgi:hypothetical protein